jgi:hypothetical protein
MPRRLPRRFERDFLFYTQNRHKFSFCGIHIQVQEDPQGVSAKEAFYALDTHGRQLPCREPNLLKEIITCKKSINLHIRSWAEGWTDVCEPLDTYLSEFTNPPEWIERALGEQVVKVIVGMGEWRNWQTRGP